MPWKVKQSPTCPQSKPWAVINSETGRVVACHSTQESAKKQMRALYANVPESRQ